MVLHECKKQLTLRAPHTSTVAASFVMEILKCFLLNNSNRSAAFTSFLAPEEQDEEVHVPITIMNLSRHGIAQKSKRDSHQQATCGSITIWTKVLDQNK